MNHKLDRLNKFIGQHRFLFMVLIISLFLRLLFIWYPEAYVFDEVYHGFTAVEYTKGNRLAWDPWATPPAGVAYEWTHPPLAKEIMAVSLITFHTTNFWGWRIPSVILGTLCILLVYLVTKQLFNNHRLSNFAAFFYALDGLSFVQSRTGMNDIYMVFFLLLCLLLALRRQHFFAALTLGLALASKWAGIYFAFPIFFLLIWQKSLPKIVYYLVLPPLVYLLSYIPYFLNHYTWPQFISLQEQMFIYHTHLKATHDYASPWWSWPFNLFPVWYYVYYGPNQTIGNIFASGNPVVFILGFVAIIYTFIQSIRHRIPAIWLVLISYFSFILPWAFSPRIMFLYHYTPCLPFLSIILAYQVNQLYHKKQFLPVKTIFVLSIIGFVLIYPFLIGIPLPRPLLTLFFITNLTKNPF